MDAALIQRLIAMGRHSLLQYVADSCPWTNDQTRVEFAHVLTLADEERGAIGRLIRFLQKKHVRPLLLGSYPAHFTLMNFVTVDFLVPKLIEENEKQVADIEKCHAAAHHEEVRTAIEQYLDVKRRHLQTLKDSQATANV
jgi:hypothetical protein